jgi:nucleotide-binding universal stress UspA family protein
MLCFFDLASPPSRTAYAAGIVVGSFDLRGEVAPVVLDYAAKDRRFSLRRSGRDALVVGGRGRRRRRERRLVVKKISTVTAGR